MNDKQKQVDDWNKLHPIGTAVILTKDSGVEIKTWTVSKAELLSGHTLVIWLQGISGCYMLSCVRPDRAVSA